MGDEDKAKNKKNSSGEIKRTVTRFNNYFVATRAYRQVATALDGMGRKEDAEKFAYCGQVMQRKMLWWSVWQMRVHGFFQESWQCFQAMDLGQSWLVCWRPAGIRMVLYAHLVGCSPSHQYSRSSLLVGCVHFQRQ